MPTLVYYHRATGLIHGIYTSSHPALLAAQQQATDPAYGYCLTDAQDPAWLEEQAWVVDGQVCPKAHLLLSASAPTVPADGVTACRVTVVPFVPCTLLVNGQAVVLAREDDPLLLTADVPYRWHITVAPGPQWAAPLLIEAR